MTGHDQFIDLIVSGNLFKKILDEKALATIVNKYDDNDLVVRDENLIKTKMIVVKKKKR